MRFVVLSALPPPMPFLLVSILALAIWLAAEIPLVRECCRRFRTGPRTLPALLVLCTLVEISAAIAGSAGLLRGGDYFYVDPARDLGWLTAGVALLYTFVPVGAFLCIMGILATIFSPFDSGLFLFMAPVFILFLLSPFLRFRLLLRSPSRHPRHGAAFALLTANLPHHPFYACLILFGPHA